MLTQSLIGRTVSVILWVIAAHTIKPIVDKKKIFLIIQPGNG